MKNPIRLGVMGLIFSTAIVVGPRVEAQIREAPPMVMSSDQKFGPTLSVSFGGGTLEGYIQALQNAVGDKAVNVVVPAAAKKVVLPPIVLRDVTLYTALSAIQAAFEFDSENRFDVRPVGTQMDGAFAIQYQRVDVAAEKAMQQARGGPTVERLAKRLEVYSIRDLIDPPAGADGTPQAKVAYESILSAVDAAMGMFDEKEPPKLLFHKETGLLLVSGTQYQTEVVDNLIGRIRDDLKRRWSEEWTTKKQSAEQTRRAAIAKSELQISEKELALAEEQFDRAKKMMDQGVMSREEFNQAQIGVDRARASLERKKIELDAAMEMKSDAAGAAGGGGGGAQQVVVYDISDLASRDPNVASTMLQLGKKLGVNVQVQNNSLVIAGDEKGQDSVKTLLETMRKMATGGDAKGR